MSVAEILTSGDVVDDNGDVKPACDYPREEYDGEPAEITKAKGILSAIGLYEQSLNLPENLPGSVRSNKKAKLRIQARAVYLRSIGIKQLTKPVFGQSDYDEAMKDYYEGVQLWGSFHLGTLGNNEACDVLKQSLREQIGRFDRSPHF